MPTSPSQNTRTLTGHLVELLEYPRWVIERDVDFTDCRHGDACRWLDRNRSPDLAGAPLDELIDATETAVTYVADRHHHERGCQCHPCRWLRETRQFLRGIAHHR